MNIYEKYDNKLSKCRLFSVCFLLSTLVQNGDRRWILTQNITLYIYEQFGNESTLKHFHSQLFMGGYET